MKFPVSSGKHIKLRKVALISVNYTITFNCLMNYEGKWDL